MILCFMNHVSELLQKTGYWLCKLCLSTINEMDMLRSVDSPFDFLFKSFLNPSVGIRPWQRQQKCVLIETWGQASDITGTSQRHCQNNKHQNEQLRTNLGQAKDIERTCEGRNFTYYFIYNLIGYIKKEYIIPVLLHVTSHSNLFVGVSSTDYIVIQMYFLKKFSWD